MKKRLKKAATNLKVPTPKKARSALTATELPAKGLPTHHVPTIIDCSPNERLVVISLEGVYTFNNPISVYITNKGPK